MVKANIFTYQGISNDGLHKFGKEVKDHLDALWLANLLGKAGLTIVSFSYTENYVQLYCSGKYNGMVAEYIADLPETQIGPLGAIL